MHKVAPRPTARPERKAATRQPQGSKRHGDGVPRAARGMGLVSLNELFPGLGSEVAPAPRPQGSTGHAPPPILDRRVTGKFIEKQKPGWTFSDMLRDRKELDALRQLRTELMLEGSERGRLESGCLVKAYFMWILFGFMHGGHWLYLAAKASDPRLAYLARGRNRALDGALKKVETMIRTLEQQHDTVAPDPTALGAAMEEDARRRSVTIVGAAGLRGADASGKSDPYAVVRWNEEWVGQTDPVFKTLEPKWGSSFEVEIPKGETSGTLLVEVFDYDASSGNDFLGRVSIEVAESGLPAGGRARPQRHQLLSKSGRSGGGELTLRIEKAESTAWIPGDLKSMRAEMARIFKIRNAMALDADDGAEGGSVDRPAPVVVQQIRRGPRAVQLVRHVVFYWVLLVGTWLLRLLSIPSSVQCQHGTAQQSYLMDASCLLHEQPLHVGLLYTAHLYCFVCTLCHWIFDAVGLYHTSLQVMRRERLTLLGTRRKPEAHSFTIVVSVGTLCALAWGLIAVGLIDECFYAPCLNGATCFDRFADFTCDCVAGWTGRRCETDINECASAPCLNGAACIDSNQNGTTDFVLPLDAFSCACLNGYAKGRCTYDYAPILEAECTINLGAVCDWDLDECTSFPCRHGAICLDSAIDSSISGDAFACLCREGWANGLCEFPHIAECSIAMGGQCDLDIDECVSTPCKNGAVCSESTGASTRDGSVVQGYTVTNIEPTLVGHQGNDVSAGIDAPINGTIIGLRAGSMSDPVNIPFAFPFFESAPLWKIPLRSYSRLRISPNGFVAFEDQVVRVPGAGCCPERRSLPQLNFGAIIAPCWGHFDPPHGSVTTEFRADSFVVSFDQVPLTKTCKNLRVSGSCSDLYNGDYVLDPRMPLMNGRPRYVNSHGSRLYWAATSQPKWRIDTTPESVDTVHAEFVGVQDRPPFGWHDWNMLCTSGERAAWGKRSVQIECADDSASNSEMDRTASWQLALFEDGTFFLEIDSCPLQDTSIGWQASAKLAFNLCTVQDESCHFNRSIFRAEPDDGRNFIDSYSCTCGANTPGWGGENCEDDLDECLSRPCTSGSTCHDSTTDPDVPINAYRCSCPPGYAGGVCSYAFLPQYDAECTVQIGGNCNIDVNECVSAPCKNGGTCTDSTSAGVAMLVDIYSCSCVAGFASGVCKYDFIAEYTDLCSIAAGGNCDVDVDECASSPCQNGATCAESAADSSVIYHDYTCACIDGYANGICAYNVISQYLAECTDQDGNCNLDVDECVSIPCLNGATCADSTTAIISSPNAPTVSVDAFACTCAPGWANGVCAPDTIPGFERQCSVWEGGICDQDIDECSSDPCNNGSACTDSINDTALPADAYRCTCTSGFADGMCAYGFIVEYTPECTVSINGNCGIDVDECVSNPCQNSASCTESRNASQITIHSYRCTCIAGYANGVCSYDFISQYSSMCAVAESTHSLASSGNCDVDVNECASGPCLHGSICHDSTTNANISEHAFQCECGAGYADGRCNYTVIPQFAPSCKVLEGGKCGVDVNECASNPCSNEAACAESQTPFLCSETNLTGSRCTQWHNSDAYTNSSIDAYSCRCLPGWANGICSPDFIGQYSTECTVAEGGDCNLDINECSSNPCMNAAVCNESSTDVSVSVNTFTCDCKPGWANGMCAKGFLQAYEPICFEVGGVCDIDIDECDSNPCKFSNCRESNTNSTISIDAYSCTCPIGWANGICAPGFIPEVHAECTIVEGGNCDLDINECLSSPCLNGAICTESSTDPSIAIDSYSCSCSAGWVNGVCPPIHPGLAADYVSNCLPHHNNSKTSDNGNCDFGINECTSNPCERGSVCDSNESAPGAAVAADNFSCACLPGWANGVCATGFISEFQTECTRVNGGVCDLDIDECASFPCLNGVCNDSTLEPTCAEYGDPQCCEEQASLVPIFVPQPGACSYLQGAFVECNDACVPEWDCSASVAFSHLTLRLLYGMHCNESLWRAATNSSSSRRSLRNELTASWSAPLSGSGSFSDSFSGSESGSWAHESQPIRWSAAITVDATLQDITHNNGNALNHTYLLPNVSNVSDQTGVFNSFNASYVNASRNLTMQGTSESMGLGDTTNFEQAFRIALSGYLDTFVNAALVDNAGGTQSSVINETTDASNVSATNTSNRSNATKASGHQTFYILPNNIVINSIRAGSVVVEFSVFIPPGDYSIYAATETAFDDLQAEAYCGSLKVGPYSVIAMTDVEVTSARFIFEPCGSGTYEATPATATHPPICEPISECFEFEFEQSGPTATSDRKCVMCNSTIVSTFEICRAEPCRESCANAVAVAAALASRCNSTAVIVVGGASNSFIGMLSATNALVEETGCGKSFAVCPRFCREYQRAKRDPVPWNYPLHPLDHICTNRYRGVRTAPIAIVDREDCFDGALAQLGVAESISMDAFSCQCSPGWADGLCAKGHITEYANLCYIKEGGRCGVDINECNSFPCQNGATCRDSSAADFHQIDEYVCDCAYGWEGEHCELSISPCLPRPNDIAVPEARTNGSRWQALWGSNDCHEYAQCLHVGPGLAYCECIAGTVGTGQLCTDYDECTSNPCQNGGVCSARLLSCSAPGVCRSIDYVWNKPWLFGLDWYQCTCPIQYYGHDCEHKRQCTFGLTIHNSNRNVSNPCTGLIGDSCNFTCDAGHSAVGDHQCDARGHFSGGRCVRTCYSSAKFMVHKGYMYGLMSGAPKNDPQDGCDFGSFVPVSGGWELPPADDDFLDVANLANWNTHVVEAGNGFSAYTANHGTRGWFCNDSAAAVDSCNVLEHTIPGSEWNLGQRKLSWSHAPPYYQSWNQSGDQLWYDLSPAPVRDSEFKVTHLRPRNHGKQWSIPTSFTLGRIPMSCIGAQDTHPDCATLVPSLGCDAVIDVNRTVGLLCFGTCCHAGLGRSRTGQLLGEPGVQREISKLIPLQFDFPYFDQSVDSIRVTYTGLVHLTNSSDIGCCNTTQLPNNGTALIAPFWEDDQVVGVAEAVPVCTASTLANSLTICAAGVVGTVCNFTCIAGYSPRGQHTCDEDGHFVGGSCSANPCTAGNSLVFSTTTCTRRAGHVCDYECAFGYTANGTHTCGADGNFSGGSCVPNACRMEYPAKLEDFEDEAAGNWSGSAAKKTTACGSFGNILGGVGVGRKTQQMTKIYDMSLFPHDSVFVELDVVKLDGYNRQLIQIYGDGAMVWSRQFAQVEGQQICGSIYRNELSQRMSVVVPHTADLFTLTVMLARNSNPTDEYFAIDNVSVVASTYSTKINNSDTICRGTVGQVCMPQCTAGYRFLGTHTCGLDGFFSGGTCVANSCTSGLHVAHSNTTCSGVTGDVCDYVCDEGYANYDGFGNVREHICGVDGSFEDGECLPIGCFEGNSVSKGTATCIGVTGDVCALSCNSDMWPGSTPFGLARYRVAGLHQCEANGVFTGGACILSDICDIDIGCDTHATCVQSSDPLLPQYACICDVGYWGSGTLCFLWTECEVGVSYETTRPGQGSELLAATDRVCTPVTQCGPGFYEGLAPTLVSDRLCIACSPGSYQPSNGSVMCPLCPVGTYDHDQNENTSCALCPSGTHQPLVGQVSCRLCPAGTVDSDADPTTQCTPCGLGFSSKGGTSPCTPIACTYGLTLPNSDTLCSGVVGAQCIFSCKSGYTAQGQRFCTREGAFVGGQCLPVACMNGIIPHSASTCVGDSVGEECTYTCNEGYVKTGTHLCLSNGTFAGGSCKPAQCLRGNHIHQSPTVCQGTTHDECEYHCNAGYLKQGIHRCGVDGAFSGGACTITTVTYAHEHRDKFVLDFRRTEGGGSIQVHWQLALRTDGDFEINIDHDVPQKPHPVTLPGYVIGYQNYDGSEGQTICSSTMIEQCIARNETMLLHARSYSVGACDHRIMMRKKCETGMCELDADCSIDFCHAGRMVAHSNRDYDHQCTGLIGQSCPYICHAGYTATSEHVCQTDGQFRGGVCVAEPCTPATIAHSERNSSHPCTGYTDDVCSFSCDAGFTAEGTHKCRSDGTFGGGRCRANPCTYGNRILNSDKIGSSMKTCSQLEWTNAPVYGSSAVCGDSSDINLRWPCTEGDQDHAHKTCRSLHARLCTAAELAANEAAGSGCGFDNRRVWSASNSSLQLLNGSLEMTTCADNETVTLAGKTVYATNHPTQCTFRGESHAIRCCADDIPGCMGGTHTVCDYTCNAGYTKLGDHVCGIDGVFRGGQCTPNPCTNGTTIEHSNTTCIGGTAHVCDYQCLSGHTAVGEHICEADATFRGGTCQPNECMMGMTIPFSTGPCTGATGDVCNFTCMAGYTAAGVHECMPNGTFVGGVCVPDPCTAGRAEDHFVAACNGSTGHVCDFTCEEGWTSTGSHVCGPDHVYRGGNCTINSCTTSFVPDSPTRCAGQTGDVCEFTCYAGYSPEGVHTCRPNGNFQGGVCIGVDCSYGISIPNSPTQCIGLRAGDPPCNYTCDPGYTKQGDHICGRGGKLDGGSCQADACAEFHPPHSPTTCNGQTTDVCEFSCDTGYSANGTLYCGGNHSFINGSCVPNPCSNGTTVEFSAILCAGGTTDVCDIECFPGYSLSGQHICGTDAVFRGGTCVANSCAPAQLAHSPTVCQGSTGYTCAYACDEGYAAYGSQICGASGTFAGGACLPETCTTGNNISHALQLCTGVTNDVCEYVCKPTFTALGTHRCGTDNVWAGGWCLAWMGLVAYTSFEEPIRTDDTEMLYQDNPPSGSVSWFAQDHLLSNNVGQNPVAYTRCSNGGAELGFKSYYIATGGYGLTDGDRFGVVGDSTTAMQGGGAGMAPHGNQYFIMEDTDGYAFVVLDSIGLTGLDHVELTFWMLIDQATWEYTDSVRVWAADASGQEVVVFSDTDLDDQIENNWVQHSGVLHDTGHLAAHTLKQQLTIIFGSGSSSGSEGIWMDYFKLTGYAANPLHAAKLVGDTTPDPCTSELVVPAAIAGCTSPSAYNFKQWASVDDGSCVFTAFDMFGCQTSGRMPSAFNIMVADGQHYITPATLAVCAQSCLDKFGCISFAFSAVQNRCYLKSTFTPSEFVDISSDTIWYSFALHGCTVTTCGGQCT